MPIDRITVMDNSRQAGCCFSESYYFMKMMRAKRFCVREELNRFEPICFTLSVVTVENIYPRREIDLTLEVTKAFDFDRFEEHCWILSYAHHLTASQKRNEHRNKDARSYRRIVEYENYSLIGITIYL